MKYLLILFLIFSLNLLEFKNVNAQVVDLSGINQNNSQIQNNGWIRCAAPPNCTFKEFIDTVNYIIQRLILLSLIFVSIIFAWAGFLYLFSAGDSSKIKKAHDMLTKAAIGFMIVLSAFLIVELIANTLGLQSSIIKFN